jgi:hypothetical protein
MPRHFGSVFRPNKSISTGENFFAPDSTLLPDDYLARHAVHKRTGLVFVCALGFQKVTIVPRAWMEPLRT